MPRTSILLLLFASLLLTGCRLTTQARSVEPSGFLGDTSEFRSGDDGEALLVYRNDEADMSVYRRVQLAPVVAHASEDSELAELGDDELQALLDYFDAALRSEIGAVVELADGPAPDVARLEVALTDAKGAGRLRNLTSTVMPYGRAISAVKSLTTGTHSAVGRAQMEFQVVDSSTGERLGAGVDARVGTKSVRDALSRWSDTKDAIDLWSSRIAQRLSASTEDG